MQITGSSRLFQDGVTTASGTANAYINQLIRQKTISAINTGVTTPIASSLVVEGPPIAGTNQTITNPYSLNILTGTSRFSGPLALAQSRTSNTINLTAPSNVTNSYVLTLPTAPPLASGQALLSDPSGNLSWGNATATQMTFNGMNNLTTAANVTGLVVSSSPAVIPVYVFVNASISLAAIITLTIYLNAAGTYSLEDTSVGDNTGVTFGVLPSGQVTYQSGNYTGFTSLKFLWYMPYTPVSSVTSSLSLTSSLTLGTTTFNPFTPNPSSYTLTLPAALPTVSGQAITGDTLGNLTWTNVSPTGAVIAFVGVSAPSGWLLCQGQAVSRTTFSILFTLIGTTYGTGDGSTTFNVPDLRGSFVRGTDNGRGLDSGRGLGSYQSDALQNITGTAAIGNGYGDTRSAVENSSGALYAGNSYQSFAASKSQVNNTARDLFFDASRVVRAANETRPVNLAMNYIIKT